MTDDALARYRANRLIQQVKSAQKTEHVDPVVVPCEDCPDDEPVTAASPNDIVIHGPAVQLGVRTGDGRKVRPGGLTWDLALEGVPIKLGHDGIVLGRVDAFVDDGGAILAEARLFDTEDPEAAAAVVRMAELITENAIGWSVMFDDEEVEATFREPVATENEDGTTVVRFRSDDQMFETVSARIRHLAFEDTPAFPGARPSLGPLPVNASAVMSMVFPRHHFATWDSGDPVPLQVTPDGRVWGHAAGDGCFRNGTKYGKCEKYTVDPDPRMRNFHTGTVTLEDGSVIRAGSLTCASLHASISFTRDQQRQHHENTSTIWARVVAWNDTQGRLCVSGSVVPGLDQSLLAQVVGTPLSLEAWPVPGVRGNTLCALHTVVTPAWPVT